MFDPSDTDRTIVSAIVREKDHFTVGRWTGKTGPHDESFEFVIEDPFVDTDKAFYHKEDLFKLTEKNIDKYIRSDNI